MKPHKILKKCLSIFKERGKQYGDVYKDFRRVSDILYITRGLTLKPSQIIEVMIAVKDSRERNKHKEDNIIDKINYEAIRLYLKEKENA